MSLDIRRVSKYWILDRHIYDRLCLDPFHGLDENCFTLNGMDGWRDGKCDLAWIHENSSLEWRRKGTKDTGHWIEIYVIDCTRI